MSENSFLTPEVQSQIKKLSNKEIDRIISFCQSVKSNRKFSIYQPGGKSLINADHFALKTEKDDETLPPESTEEIIRRVSQTFGQTAPVNMGREHVFQHNDAEVEWYYIVDGEDVVYPIEFCDVLEALFRKPGHTGNHQKKTPYLDGNTTCEIDLHLMRHTVVSTNKSYPLRRKKNPHFTGESKYATKKKSKPAEPPKSNEGGEEMPEDDGGIRGMAMRSISSTFMTMANTAAYAASHPTTQKTATQATKMVSSVFSRSLRLFGNKGEVSEGTIEQDKKEFDVIDENHDGKLSLDELKKAFGSTYDEQAIINVFGDLDKDGNGTIDFQEFRAAIDAMREQTASEEVVQGTEEAPSDVAGANEPTS